MYFGNNSASIIQKNKNQERGIILALHFQNQKFRTHRVYGTKIEKLQLLAKDSSKIYPWFP